MWREPLLQKYSEVNPAIQSSPLLLKLKAWELAHFTPRQRMQHWRIARRLGPVRGWGGGVLEVALGGRHVVVYSLYTRIHNPKPTQK